jgi:hypothetical protein
MSTEDNKSIVRRVIEEVRNHGDSTGISNLQAAGLRSSRDRHRFLNYIHVGGVLSDRVKGS